METEQIPLQGLPPHGPQSCGGLGGLPLQGLPLDLYQNIINFLSMKDKINVRQVSKIFKQNITQCTMIMSRLPKIYSIERKLSDDMILTFNSNFVMYTDYTKNGIHTRFRINNHSYNRCIVYGCREKRLGNIYLPLYIWRSRFGWNFYSKRIIPYCLNCYNKWG